MQLSGRQFPGRRLLAGLAVALLGLLTVVGVATPASAQESGPALEVTGIDLSEFPTVKLRFAVGAGVTDAELDAASVQVTENGDDVDEVVTPLTDQVISVLLAIDSSGSMQGDPIAKAKVAAAELLGELPPDAKVAVVGFGNQAQLLSGFTTDRDSSRQAINSIAAQGGTTLYDAVRLSAQQVRASDADRTAVVVLTDGADSDSTATLDDAVSAIEGTDTAFYAVALQTGETDTTGITAIAEAANGRVVSAEDSDALTALYVDLGQRIVNQYQVEFVSTTQDPTGTYEIGVAGTSASTSVELALPDRAGAVTTTTVQRELPEPLVVSVEPGLFEQGWVVWLGAALLAIAIAVMAVLVAPSGDGRRRRPERRRSLRSDAEASADGNVLERTFASVRGTVTRFSERAVERTESEGRIDAALDRAGLIMRAGEYVALVVAIAIGAGVLLYLLFGVVLAAVGFLVPLLGASAFLNYKASRRNAKFADQLGDTLLVMSGALRSGFGVGQAIDTVAEEMEPPMSTEFRRAILETRLGRDIEDALDGVAKRVQNEDFEWVVDAMRINRQVGGDLAAILDQVAETIRARNRLKRQVAALTAEGRMSAYVLGILPVAIGLILYSSNPDYLEPLFTRTAGQIALAFAVGLLVAGALWLKKLIDIEY